MRTELIIMPLLLRSIGPTAQLTVSPRTAAKGSP
jgi:hypothetical protein